MCSTTLDGVKLKICLVSDKNASLLKLSFNIGLSVLLSKKNVLQGQHEADKIWSKEGFYAVVIFLSIFVIIVTCLMVSLFLYIFYLLLSPPFDITGYTAIKKNVGKTGNRSKALILLGCEYFTSNSRVKAKGKPMELWILTCRIRL